MREREREKKREGENY